VRRPRNLLRAFQPRLRVQLRDNTTHRLVADEIEIKRSTRLGVLQKSRLYAAQDTASGRDAPPPLLGNGYPFRRSCA